MPNGNAVANVSLATSESWKDKSTGEQQEKTEWHRVVFFNRLAEIVEQYVKKGTKLQVYLGDRATDVAVLRDADGNPTETPMFRGSNARP